MTRKSILTSPRQSSSFFPQANIWKRQSSAPASQWGRSPVLHTKTHWNTNTLSSTFSTKRSITSSCSSHHHRVNSRCCLLLEVLSTHKESNSKKNSESRRNTEHCCVLDVRSIQIYAVIDTEGDEREKKEENTEMGLFALKLLCHFQKHVF